MFIVEQTDSQLAVSHVYLSVLIFSWSLVQQDLPVLGGRQQTTLDPKLCRHEFSLGMAGGALDNGNAGGVIIEIWWWSRQYYIMRFKLA
jgi:hypothetical protein